jgi:hypothetical protein
MERGEAGAEAIAQSGVDDFGMRVLELEFRLVEHGLHDRSRRHRKLTFEPFDLAAQEHDRLAGGTHLLARVAAKALTPASDFVEFSFLHGAIMSFRCKEG